MLSSLSPTASSNYVTCILLEDLILSPALFKSIALRICKELSNREQAVVKDEECQALHMASLQSLPRRAQIGGVSMLLRENRDHP
jgi:hypothetical protein